MNISAVIGIFFDQNYSLLTIQNSRGVDVPGGHKEKGETVEQTITREAYEEAGAVINNIQIVEEIKTKSGIYHNRNMAFVTGEIISFDRKKAKFMAIPAFLETYTQNKQLMEKVLRKAERAYERKRLTITG